MRQRCVLSLAILAIVLAAGCARKPDDTALVTNIKSQMFSDAQLKDASLQVTSKDGQVTLSGSVPSDAARYEAYKIATQTPACSKVNDQMTVQQAQLPMPEAQPAPPAPPAPPLPPMSRPLAKRGRNSASKNRSQLETADNAGPCAPPRPLRPVPAAARPASPRARSQPAPAPQPPCATATPAATPPPPPQPEQVVIPSSTTLTIRMIDGVDSSVNKPGEIFHASLDAPIVVDNQVIIPKGADVYVRLANASFGRTRVREKRAASRADQDRVSGPVVSACEQHLFAVRQLAGQKHRRKSWRRRGRWARSLARWPAAEKALPSEQAWEPGPAAFIRAPRGESR